MDAHFADEESEAQKGEVNYPEPHSQTSAELGIEAWSVCGTHT